jgi:hypothetical protein
MKSAGVSPVLAKPVTDAYRVLYLVNSLVGMSATSLVLTYVMQVYSRRASSRDRGRDRRP